MNLDLLRTAGDLPAHLVSLGANLLLQSSVLIAAGLLVAHFCRRRGPALQSTILRATLIAVIACPLASWLFELAGVPGGKWRLPHPGGKGSIAAASAAVAVAGVAQPAVALAKEGDLGLTSKMAGNPAKSDKDSPTAGRSTVSVPASARPAANGPTSNISAKTPVADATPSEAAPTPVGPRREEPGALVLVYAVLAALWLIGAGCFLTRLAVCHRRIARMRRESDLPEVAVFESCGSLARELAIASPEVRLHRELKSPLLVGLFRPAILLPDVKDLERLVASREVLTHELAHRARGDCFWHLLSRIVTAILWYQPLLWMLARRIEESGEEVCDNYVIARAPDRRTYAHQLVQLAEHLQYSSTEALAGTGVIAFRSALGQRVVRILDVSRNLSLRSGTRAAATVAVTTALATSTVGLIGVTLHAEPETGPRMTVRRLLADAANIGENLTADGKHIRGLDWETGDVVQYEFATGEKSRIKNRGSWSGPDKTYEDHLLSPDGEQIVYFSYSQDWIPRLQVRNLDGSVTRTLSSGKGSYFYLLDWSPNGKSIMACRSGEKRSDSKNELTLISVADGTVRVLKDFKAHVYMVNEARFSPDARYIAFSLVRDGNPPHGDVFLMTADGRDEIVVAGHPAEDRLIGWSPDGGKLIFRSDRSGTWDLWTVPVADGKQQGKPTLLKRDFGSPSNYLVGLAPDGSCYYTSEIEHGVLLSGEIDLASGQVLVPPAPVALRYTGFVSMLTWSPDGKNLLYVSNRTAIGPGRNILTIRNAATGVERFPSTGLRFVNQISWTPDGRSVLALGMSEQGEGIYRIDAETGVITKWSDRGYLPRLCPDGKTLVYAYGAIWKRDIGTGEEAEAIKGKFFYYDLSPDGREIACEQDGVVKVVPLNGGEPRELTRELGKGLRVKWTGDGRFLVVYSRQTSRGIIWFVPAQGGAPVKLDLALPKMEFFALHPDNRHFVCSVKEESKSELWVLENFLPKAALAAR